MSLTITVTLRETSEKIEGVLNSVSRPIKPYLPAVSRFLVVATFMEDALRILFQWSAQVSYLQKARHFPGWSAHAFLGMNAMAMMIASLCIITKRQVGASVVALSAVMVLQTLGYGLLFNFYFFLRNLSVAGGLLLSVSESLLRVRRANNASALFGLPQLNESERHKYFQLAGRILLVLLFLGFVVNGQWTLARIIVCIVGLVACGMVAVGFRAKWSASLLVTVLCVMNVLVNNWWTLNYTSTRRDFLKYDFFQTLSIMGGLLLLISIGPGGLSYDEKKKEF